MVSDEYKKVAHNLVLKAIEKGLIISYEDFCKSELSKETSLTDEEIAYYIARNKEVIRNGKS